MAQKIGSRVAWAIMLPRHSWASSMPLLLAPWQLSHLSGVSRLRPDFRPRIRSSECDAFARGEAVRLSVAEDAIERIGQLEYATVVDAEGSPRRRLVTTGAALEAGRVEVLSGLAAGERVALR